MYKLSDWKYDDDDVSKAIALEFKIPDAGALHRCAYNTVEPRYQETYLYTVIID